MRRGYYDTTKCRKLSEFLKEEEEEEREQK